jgi:hypothetical protein
MDRPISQSLAGRFRPLFGHSEAHVEFRTPSKLSGSAIFNISGRGSKILLPPSPTPVKYKSLHGMHEIAKSQHAESIRSRRRSFPATSTVISPESALNILLFPDSTSKSTELDPPHTPTLEPVRLPSIADPAVRRTSWRLSFASGNRSCHLRALSQQYGQPFNNTPGSQPLCPTEVRARLRDRGTRASSQAFKVSSDSGNIGEPPSNPHSCSWDKTFDGVDHTPPVRLHEMRIHQRLASHGLSSSISSPSLSCWRSTHERNMSITSITSHCSQHDSSRSFQDTKSSVITSLELLDLGPTIFRDYTSSRYGSSNVSLQPTPACSQFNLARLMNSAKFKNGFLNNTSNGS